MRGWLVLLLILSLFAQGAQVSSLPDAKATLEALEDDLNVFAFTLFKQLRTDKENHLVSPYSLSAGMGMAYLGARGGTAVVLEQGMRFPGAPVPTASLFHALHKDLASSALEMTNGLWVQSRQAPLATFVSGVREFYGGAVAEVDFRRDRASALQKINAWVKEKTHGTVPQLLTPQDVDAATRLVLVNALYFKNAWARPFEEAQTEKREFIQSDQGRSVVPMMQQVGFFPYYRGVNFSALKLAYEESRFALYLLLPQEGKQLGEVELSLQSYLDMRSSFETSYMRLQLPRFSIDDRLSLQEPLEKLGMASAFLPGADFSGMNGLRDLYLQKVVQASHFALDEKGTEAAVASGVVAGVTSIGAPPIPFIVDHPFLFLLVDEKSGLILFMGQVAQL